MNLRIAGASVILLGALAAVARADDKPAPPLGRFRGDIIDPVSKEPIMKVALHTPAKLPDQPALTVLVLHHGYQGNENNYIGLTVEALKRLKLDDEFVVISGKSQGPGWTTKDDDRVLRIIAWAKDNYPIDARRVFLFGSSNGAAFVGRFGSEHQDILAGVVGYCGSYKFGAEHMKNDKPAARKTAWYFVHGDKDNAQNSRKACDFLKEHGYAYVFRQMNGYGHTDIWDSKGHPDSAAANAVRDDWLLWMHSLRHGSMKPAPAGQKTLGETAAALTAGKLNQPEETLQEVVRIGGVEGEAVLQQALRSSDESLRLAAARSLRRTPAEIVELLEKEKAALVRAALPGVTASANWGSVPAEKALVQLALDQERTPVERALVVEGINTAVRLRLLGNFKDDHGMIPTLGKLLGDPAAGIRKVAFQGLRGAGADSFSYDPEKAPAQQEEAIAKWRQWIAERCAPAPAKP